MFIDERWRDDAMRHCTASCEEAVELSGIESNALGTGLEAPSLLVYSITEGPDEAWNEGFMDLVNNEYGRRLGRGLDDAGECLSNCGEIWEQGFLTQSPRHAARQWSEAGW